MIEEKKCTGCKEIKPIENFSKDSSNSSGYQCKCKDCKKKVSYFDPSLDPTKTKKQCTGECKEEKFLTQFSRSDKGRLGYHNHCNDCRKLERRKTLNNNPKTEGTKFCGDCNKDVDVKDFSKDIYSIKDGLQVICRPCQFKRISKSHSKFEPFISNLIKDCRERCKKKAKNGRILEFTITKEDVIKLYKEQNGKCVFTKVEMTHNAINDRKEGDCHILNPYNISITSEIKWNKSHFCSTLLVTRHR
jgi:hypothetical protein